MTSPVDTSVKFIHSAMAGAPVMNGIAGSRIAVLDACLINGFGLKNCDSLVISNNVATMNIAAGHSFEVGSVAMITGATPAVLNGEQKITAVTGTSASFATTGITDQAATGTITAKVAPLANWTKPFSGTNLAVYRSTDVTGTQIYLRVDDTNAKWARVVGYETMTDVNTGTGMFPTALQWSGGLYWPGSQTADSTSRGWIVTGDSRMFYFCREYYNTTYPTNYEIHGFGDLVPTKTGDAYGAVLTGNSGDLSAQAPGSYTANLTYSNPTASNTNIYTPRSFTGVGSSCEMCRGALTIGSVSTVQSGTGNLMPFPNPSDGGLYVSPLYVTEKNTTCYRGVLPGVYFCLQAVLKPNFTSKDTLTGVVSIPGRTLRAVCSYDSTYSAPSFFDTTGPWR